MTTTTNSATTGTGSTTALTLTRRGRLLLLGLPVLLATVALLAGLLMATTSVVNQAQASTGEQPDASAVGVSAVEVSVAPGDTLWSLAQEAPTDDDVREVMAAITEINNLQSSQLQPGEVLHVPAD